MYSAFSISDCVARFGSVTAGLGVLLHEAVPDVSGDEVVYEVLLLLLLARGLGLRLGLEGR